MKQAAFHDVTARGARARTLGHAGVLAALLASGCGDDALRDRGFAALSSWEQLPELSGRSYRLSSSADPQKREDYPIVDVGNKDFNNFAAVCSRNETMLQETARADLCEHGVEGYILAARDDGPGYVSRIWLTIASPVGAPGFEEETIRIYVDDLAQPAYEGRLAAWKDGTDAVFTAPFTRWNSGALLSYLPLSYRSKLWVVLDNLSPVKLHYFQVNTVSSGATRAFDPSVTESPDHEAARALLAAAGDNPNRGFSLIEQSATIEVPAGETVTALDHQGAGTIELLQLDVDRDEALDQLRQLSLAVWWDGAGAPAIDVPLLSLFACEATLATLRTLPLRVEQLAHAWRFSLFVPMPFSSRARVALKSAASEPLSLRVSVGIDEARPAGRWGKLHAVYREQEAPVAPGSDYELLDVAGAGKYIGTIMSLRGHADEEYLAPSAFNFLEGDERIEIDGELRVQGTGTEDYFNGGFYFKDGPYDHPFGAVNELWKSDDELRGRISAARWHVLTDEIDFARSLRLTLEYGADKPSVLERYSSVALFYLE